MEIDALATAVAAHWAGVSPSVGVVRPSERVVLFRAHKPIRLLPDVYDPVVCVVVQGKKELALGDETIELLPGDSLLVSHDTPVTAHITSAHLDAPYLSIVLLLDLELIRSLVEEVQDTLHPHGSSRSTVAQRADPQLIDALRRYLALSKDPTERRVMEPLLLREIHFRALMAPQAGMLRQLLRPHSRASRISRAITTIRRDFRTALAVVDLAREAGMSVSSFHKHFRDITSNTPLQYQKELRLMEARRDRKSVV